MKRPAIKCVDPHRPVDELLPDFRAADSIFRGRCYYCGEPTRGIVCRGCDRKVVEVKR